MRGRSGWCATSSAYGLSVHPPQSGLRQPPAGRDAGGALFPSRSSSPLPVPRLAAPGQLLHSRGPSDGPSLDRVLDLAANEGASRLPLRP